MPETLKEASQNVKRYLNNKWVKWIHGGSKPAYTHEEKAANTITGSVGRHCAICLNLNECCYIMDKKPTQPAHPNCHCVYKNITTITATALCPIAKFTDYIFSEKYIGNGKRQLFEAWGYYVEDSEELKRQFEKQAKMQYELGEYELGLLNDYGQRININITLKNKKTGADITFYSGWMVYPDGKIDLATPYGG